MTSTDNMPMEHFDKRKEVENLFALCIKRFRHAPAKNESQTIINALCAKLKLSEISEYLETLHTKRTHFPYLGEVEKDIAIIERARKYQYTIKPQNAHHERNKPWVSKQAAGTPALAEALFTLIKKGLTGTPRFTIARNSAWAKRLTDDELWICYEYWTRGEVHPLTLADDPFAEKRGDLKK